MEIRDGTAVRKLHEKARRRARQRRMMVDLAGTSQSARAAFDTAMAPVALTGQRDIVVVTVFAGNLRDKGRLAMGLHHRNRGDKPRRV
jgi:hypothetical protein